MTVRVGIVSWNTAALLDRCLDALPAALGDLEAEVVVVDNASTDGSAAVAAAHAGVTVVRNETNAGYPAAMDRALAGPPVEVLVALNPDTVAPPGSLATLVERLRADPTVGIVVPRLLEVDGRDQHTVYRFPSLAVAAGVCFAPAAVLRRGLGRRLWLEGWSDHARRVDVDWAIGAVHVVRAAALDGEEPYDRRWFMYAEDLDLCWRVHRRGWVVRLEGDVTVTHVGNAAGAIAWGDDRTARWLVPTYDWLARARGGLAARAWAAVNAVGVCWLATRWRVLARLAPRRWGHLRGWAAGITKPLPIHLAVLRRGVGSVAALAEGPPARQ